MKRNKKNKGGEERYQNCEVNSGKVKNVPLEHANRRSILIAVIVTAIIIALIYYFGLFTINARAPGFWGILIFGSLLYLAVKSFGFMAICHKRSDVPENERMYQNDRNKKHFIVPAALIVAVIVLAIIGLPIFHAGGYASIMTVEDSVFEEDLAETLSTDSIALMDTSSAQMLGDREIGSLSDVVSQYNVSDDYAQIDMNGSPLKVSALEYAGFFKWINNRSNGVPGYVTVNPVSMSAEYVECSEGMVYVPSAYLQQDLARHIRFRYPTKIFGNLHFEIDEDGNPYYVASVYTKKIALFGGQTVKGAIIVDPTDGSSEYVDLEDVPQWVDVVYPGDLLCTQYNWYGIYDNGFVNSIIGKKGCKQVTQYSSSTEDYDSDDSVPVNDYGYVAKDGDIWIYTGITSVNGDSSNIGFLMANQRTGETHYYSVAGADEKSAMAAAEGEVQEKGYQASFPSLINVDSEPTYIMVLKDDSGLVKMYAAVNVEQYNLVTTATTQEECIQKYRSLIGSEDTSDTDTSDEDTSDGDTSDTDDTDTSEDTSDTDDDTGDGDTSDTEEEETIEATDSATITVAAVKYIDIDGNTYVYLIDTDENLYRQKASSNEQLLFIEEGDVLNITYNGIELVSFEEAATDAD